MPKKQKPKVVIEQTIDLVVDDPPNLFMTASGHLAPDLIHHSGPWSSAPLYEQTSKKMGWDPRAGDDPPWVQRSKENAKKYRGKGRRARRKADKRVE
jgi:hypothetical protein